MALIAAEHSGLSEDKPVLGHVWNETETRPPCKAQIVSIGKAPSEEGQRSSQPWPLLHPSPVRKLGRGQQLPQPAKRERTRLVLLNRAGAPWREHGLPQPDRLQLLSLSPGKALTWAVQAYLRPLFSLNCIESQRCTTPSPHCKMEQPRWMNP